MPRLPRRARLLFGVLLLTALLEEGRGLPMKKPWGPWLRPRSHARLAEVSGGARGSVLGPPPGPSALAARGVGLGCEQRPPGARARARCAGPHEPPLPGLGSAQAWDAVSLLC